MYRFEWSAGATGVRLIISRSLTILRSRDGCWFQMWLRSIVGSELGEPIWLPKPIEVEPPPPSPLGASMESEQVTSWLGFVIPGPTEADPFA